MASKRKHLERKVNAKPKADVVQCKLCGENLKGGLSLHIAAHKEDNAKLYQCTICHIPYVGTDYLKRHMIHHPKSCAFKCTKCDVIVKTLAETRKHRVSHKITEGKHKCSKCYKSFGSTCALKAHMYTHTDGKKMECPVCLKGLSGKTALINHMKRHTGEKSFSCEECGKSFSQLNNMKRHKLIHTGERPYACLVCDKRFRTGHHLVRHHRLHTGESPFSCGECNKTFREAHCLSRHVCEKRKSQDIKIYKCSRCEQQFKHKNLLWEHLKSHVKDHIRLFECAICDEEFTGEKYLQQHLQHHPGECSFKCIQCDTNLQNLKETEKHRNVHKIGEGRVLSSIEINMNMNIPVGTEASLSKNIIDSSDIIKSSTAPTNELIPNDFVKQEITDNIRDVPVVTDSKDLANELIQIDFVKKEITDDIRDVPVVTDSNDLSAVAYVPKDIGGTTPCSTSLNGLFISSNSPDVKPTHVPLAIQTEVTEPLTDALAQGLPTVYKQMSVKIEDVAGNWKEAGVAPKSNISGTNGSMAPTMKSVDVFMYQTPPSQEEEQTRSGGSTAAHNICQDSKTMPAGNNQVLVLAYPAGPEQQERLPASSSHLFAGTVPQCMVCKEICSPDAVIDPPQATSNVGIGLIHCRACQVPRPYQQVLPLETSTSGVPVANVYPCHACGALFVSESTLQQHVNSKHPATDVATL